MRGEPRPYRSGHHFRVLPHSNEKPRLCACGCGELTTVHRGIARLYVLGHNSDTRVITEDDYTVEDRGYITPCWIGKGARGNLYGHVAITVRKRKMHAHRAMWEQTNGAVPLGLELDHLCRVPSCIRPDHLEAVTHTENMRRAITTKLTLEKAHEIRELHATGGWSLARLARVYGVHKSTIRGVVVGLTWKD